MALCDFCLSRKERNCHFYSASLFLFLPSFLVDGTFLLIRPRILMVYCVRAFFFFFFLELKFKVTQQSYINPSQGWGIRQWEEDQEDCSPKRKGKKKMPKLLDYGQLCSCSFILNEWMLVRKESRSTNLDMS